MNWNNQARPPSFFERDRGNYRMLKVVSELINAPNEWIKWSLPRMLHPASLGIVCMGYQYLNVTGTYLFQWARVTEKDRLKTVDSKYSSGKWAITLFLAILTRMCARYHNRIRFPHKIVKPSLDFWQLMNFVHFFFHLAHKVHTQTLAKILNTNEPFFELVLNSISRGHSI